MWDCQPYASESHGRFLKMQIPRPPPQILEGRARGPGHFQLSISADSYAHGIWEKLIDTVKETLPFRPSNISSLR